MRRELRELIRGVIISSGVPAVLVTHDAEEAEELGDVDDRLQPRAGDRDAHRRAARTPGASARSRRGEHRTSVTGLVPHSWLNWLGIPPWVWDPLSVSLHAAFEATIVVAFVGSSARVPPGERPLPWARRHRDRVQPAHGAPAHASSGGTSSREMGGPGPIRNAEVRLFGHPLTFTFTGIVIAQVVESFPYCLRFSRAAISGVDPRFEQAARAMGLPRWRIALFVTLPLARARGRRRCRDGVRPGPG